MMDIRDYLRMCLKKKNLTYEEFLNEVNNVKFKLGDKGIMRPSNLSNIINGSDGVNERTLMIFEHVLELPEGTLVRMKSSDNGINKKKYRKRVRDVLNEKL